MNNVSELHLDALTEIFNIGAGRAASSLSEIVGEEVQLSVPHIKFYKPSELSAASLSLNSPRLGAVKQHFSGPIDADAMLLFTEDNALQIVSNMLGSQLSSEELAEFEQEAMCEIGNIILNACLSSMADIFQIKFDSSLPLYSVDTSDEVFRQIVAYSTQELILVLHVDLVIESRASEGKFLFLLGASSLEKLLVEVNRFISNNF